MPRTSDMHMPDLTPAPEWPAWIVGAATTLFATIAGMAKYIERKFRSQVRELQLREEKHEAKIAALEKKYEQCEEDRANLRISQVRTDMELASILQRVCHIEEKAKDSQ